MERPLLNLLFGLALASGAQTAFAAQDKPIGELIDIEVEEAPAAPAADSVPEKIGKKPAEKAKPSPAAPVTGGQSGSTAEPAPADETLVVEAEPAEPEIEERAPAPEPSGPPPKGFDEFLKCGIALGKSPVTFDSQVLGRAAEVGAHAINGQEVVVEGSHPTGAQFAAYRAGRGSCVAYFLGMVEIMGPMGEMSCRGVVSRSEGPIAAGDVLYSYNALRADFDKQIGMEGDERQVKANVRCIQSGGRWLRNPREVMQLEAGRDAGVLYGQYFQASIPGYAGKKTYGRVIRVDKESCFLKIMKIYQPLQIGDAMESISRPGGPLPPQSR